MRLRALCAAAASATLLCSAAPAADYVRVPGGSFDSVLPQDTPALAGAVRVEPFELRSEPVTVGEFLSFVREHEQWQRARVPTVFAEARYLAGWADATHPGQPLDAPVTDVSWFAARAYCESEGARLPTWLEWEFASAADETRTDARDDAQWRRHILSWYERPAASRLPAVGGAPNVYGARDLHGLVWEWVDDFNALFISGDSRTQGDPDKQQFCGAGAISIVGRDSYAVLRVALLSSLNAADTTSSLGFRCAR
jgi:sulfatase modifying factor 1